MLSSQNIIFRQKQKIPLQTQHQQNLKNNPQRNSRTPFFQSRKRGTRNPCPLRHLTHRQLPAQTRQLYILPQCLQKLHAFRQQNHTTPGHNVKYLIQKPTTMYNLFYIIQNTHHKIIHLKKKHSTSSAPPPSPPTSPSSPISQNTFTHPPLRKISPAALQFVPIRGP